MIKVNLLKRHKISNGNSSGQIVRVNPELIYTPAIQTAAMEPKLPDNGPEINAAENMNDQEEAALHYFQTAMSLQFC